MRPGPDTRWEALIMVEGGHSALPSPNLVQERKERSIRQGLVQLSATPRMSQYDRWRKVSRTPYNCMSQARRFID